MDYVSSDYNYSLLFDASKFLYSIEVALAIALAAAFVYMERMKNFEKFNIDGSQRDSLLNQLCLLQALSLTFVISFAAGFFGPGLLPTATHFSVADSALYTLGTFLIILVVCLFNLKTSKEFELLRRVLMSLGKVTRLEKLGFKQ